MQTVIHFSIAIMTLLLLSCSANQEPDSVISVNKKHNDSAGSNDSTTKDDKIAMQSEITCPNCGYKKMETMPTDICLIKYNCTKCGEEMKPEKGDCCVFCTHGTHKCPSMQ